MATGHDSLQSSGSGTSCRAEIASPVMQQAVHNTPLQPPLLELPSLLLELGPLLLEVPPPLLELGPPLLVRVPPQQGPAPHQLGLAPPQVLNQGHHFKGLSAAFFIRWALHFQSRWRSSS